MQHPLGLNKHFFFETCWPKFRMSEAWNFETYFSQISLENFARKDFLKLIIQAGVAPGVSIIVDCC